MSKNTTITVSALASEVADLREIVTANTVALERVLGALGKSAPAKPVSTPVRKGKGAGKGSAKKARKAEGPSFSELRSQLREHKKAGLVPAGVSVREAQASGLMDEKGAFVGGSGKRVSKKPVATKKRSVAKVEANAPAKVPASEAPRRADGTITPKSEWALRESLAESGRFDRHEIDAIVAATA